MTNRVKCRKDVLLTKMSDKAVLRRDMLAARRRMDAAVRRDADAALVVRAVDLARGRRVAAYVPMPGEPGGPLLVPGLAAVAGALLLPALLPDGDLDWAGYSGRLAAPGRGGFQAPEGPRLGPAAIASVELVLVPAVAVDHDGRRLGRGGGSYDRALVRVRPGVPVLAVLYPTEWVERVPADAHDRPVTGVLLPDGLQSCGSRSGTP